MMFFFFLLNDSRARINLNIVTAKKKNCRKSYIKRNLYKRISVLFWIFEAGNDQTLQGSKRGYYGTIIADHIMKTSSFLCESHGNSFPGLGRFR